MNDELDDVAASELTDDEQALLDDEAHSRASHHAGQIALTSHTPRCS